MISLRTFVPALLAGMLLSSAYAQSVENRPGFKKYFDSCGVTGSFSLYDPARNAYIVYNSGQLDEMFTPASTFKICNSLIGLETGVIPDENYVIKWDGVKRWREEWNHDHDLKTAYKHSTVWYYQELARRVGGKRMKYWLDKARYGNADTSGGIDRFWLTGGLRISPRQQLDFLNRLYKGELPFSKRSMAIVRRIMIEDSTSNYVLRAKTGLSQQNNQSIGWYVGYVTGGPAVYFFATCLQSAKAADNFSDCRKEITFRILAELGILRKKQGLGGGSG